jgi:hypothetical protein
VCTQSVHSLEVFDDTDPIGLVVLVIGLEALFIAAKLSPCRKRPPG